MLWTLLFNAIQCSGAVTSAVMVRGSRDEGPFLNEFFDYYLNRLLFDKIYVLNTDREPALPWVQNHMADRFRTRVSVHHVGAFKDEALTLNKGIAFVKEDWVLNIDFDEFLVLPSHETIGAFIRRLPKFADQAWFPWVLCSSTKPLIRESLQIVEGGCHKLYPHDYEWSGKRLVRREAVFTDTLGVHKALTWGQTSYFPYTNAVWDSPVVVHNVVRGVEDLLNRVFRPYPKTVESRVDEVGLLHRALQYPNKKEMPYRFFILGVENSLPKLKAPTTVLDKIRGLMAVDTNTLQQTTCFKLDQNFGMKCGLDRTAYLQSISHKCEVCMSHIHVPPHMLEPREWRDGMCPRPLADRVMMKFRRDNFLPPPPMVYGLSQQENSESASMCLADVSFGVGDGSAMKTRNMGDGTVPLVDHAENATVQKPGTARKTAFLSVAT